jgi:hypothetical protein
MLAIGDIFVGRAPFLAGSNYVPIYSYAFLWQIQSQCSMCQSCICRSTQLTVYGHDKINGD